MYSVESQFFICILLMVNPFEDVLIKVSPSNKEVLLVEKQFASGVPVLGEEPSLVVALQKLLVMALQRDVAEDVNIMDKDGLGVVEERQCLHDATTSIHELSSFVRDVDVGIERVCLKETDHLVAEMVDVDDNGVKAIVDEVFDIAFQEGPASDLNEGLGLVVGQLFQPGTQAGGKDHGGAFIHESFVRYG